MLEKLGAGDDVLHQMPFLKDEVPYNLLHLITGMEQAEAWKTPDGRMLFAATPGHNGWLWLSEDLTEERREALLLELVEHCKDMDLSGICGASRAAEPFAKLYCGSKRLKHKAYMNMQAYVCPKVLKPVKMKGELLKADPRHREVAAEFLAGFSESAYGSAVVPASQLATAEGMIMKGGLYFWVVDELPAAMANIAHRSPRHGRINAVFTPAVMRNNGYASALVAQLSQLLQEENLEPMLYADKSDAASNKVYKKLGFIESGVVAEIRFS
ncbi:GNAT family N-acetyltransferase [Paenibacillus sp. N4]|uniref:GNAT family N-acetyltransferase n=1 Tax=Paenibacillus vietnamensis TaxID=2590547 RepID=UPI001CD108BF|nr:GNAT family N-acetyltransferase [Paenibacillus vietnamensis]MCA0756236.1 GNAT family N-acetyltransferase [Paenibacillus vietnamensis]